MTSRALAILSLTRPYKSGKKVNKDEQLLKRKPTNLQVIEDILTSVSYILKRTCLANPHEVGNLFVDVGMHGGIHSAAIAILHIGLEETGHSGAAESEVPGVEGALHRLGPLHSHFTLTLREALHQG